jgi:hypothetical protein
LKTGSSCARQPGRHNARYTQTPSRSPSSRLGCGEKCTRTSPSRAWESLGAKQKYKQISSKAKRSARAPHRLGHGSLWSLGDEWECASHAGVCVPVSSCALSPAFVCTRRESTTTRLQPVCACASLLGQLETRPVVVGTTHRRTRSNMRVCVLCVYGGEGHSACPLCEWLQNEVVVVRLGTRT